jgi:hypothetical protein
MRFTVSGLSAEAFQPLFALDDAALATRNIRRVTADSDRGFPCRISLRDAVAGESLLLLPYRHHDVDGPYRASGPIFVREAAAVTAVFDNEVPPFLLRRLLSLRAYDGAGWMHAADVVEGVDADACLRRLFADERIACIHIHNARPGCYACRVDRA